MKNPATPEENEFSIIIPAYNEQGPLEKTVRELLSVALENGISPEFIVVNDGSNDGTSEIIEKLKTDSLPLKSVSHTSNLGFGRAIMTGIENATRKRGIIVPADGQFDQRELPRFFKALDNYDLVMGERPGRTGYGFMRKLVSYTYIFTVRLLFGRTFNDVNWVQAWRMNIFEKVKPESRGTFFLLETLLRAGRAGFTIGSVPSAQLERTLGEAKGGKAGFVLSGCLDTFRFWLKTVAGKV